MAPWHAIEIDRTSIHGVLNKVKIIKLMEQHRARGKSRHRGVLPAPIAAAQERAVGILRHGQREIPRMPDTAVIYLLTTDVS